MQRSFGLLYHTFIVMLLSTYHIIAVLTLETSRSCFPYGCFIAKYTVLPSIALFLLITTLHKNIYLFFSSIFVLPACHLSK